MAGEDCLRIPFLRSRRDDKADAQPPSTNLFLNTEFAAMKERFRDRLRDDHALLVQYRGRLAAPTPELIAIVHRLSGSAGMLGFEKISAVAGPLDDDFAEPGIDRDAAFGQLLLALEEEISTGN
jgi:HPt (histidine-containing phosphotransfer) domain-containing protein